MVLKPPFRRTVNGVAFATSMVCPTFAAAQFTAVRLSESTSYVRAVRGGAIGGYVFGTSFVNPTIWTGPGWEPTTLSPTTVAGGFLYAMSVNQQFGSWNGFAAMWSGTPSSYVNLHPPSASDSLILAASSTQQAGWARALGQDRRTATLWTGSAASALSLAPAGSSGSIANAMSETQQGGLVQLPRPPGQPTALHAALWSGSAASFVDMNPAGHQASEILGMSGDQQVGYAYADATGSQGRAAMWNGTPESFRAMHPFSDGLSQMNATCGSAQVGYMNSVSFGSGAGIRAAIWFGTAESVMDLSQFLPAGYGQSIATCVEERNGVFTVGGYVRYGITDQAFVWVGVPAPGAAVILFLAAPAALGRRRASA